MNARAQAALSVRADPWVVLEIVAEDGALVIRGTGACTALVPPAVYEVRAHGVRGTEAELIRARTGETASREISLPFDSTAPFASVNSATRAQREAALRLSTTSFEEGVFIFVRTRAAVGGAARRLDLAGLNLSLQNLDGERLAVITDGDLDVDAGWASMARSFSPGAYVLTTGGSESEAFSQAVHVVAGRVTHVYATVDAQGRLAGLRLFMPNGGSSIQALEAAPENLRLDMAQRFAASGAWALVDAELGRPQLVGGGRWQWGASDDPLACCLGAYGTARSLNLFSSDWRTEMLGILPSLDAIAQAYPTLPDSLILTDVGVSPLKNLMGPYRRDRAYGLAGASLETAEESVPLFAAGTGYLVNAYVRRADPSVMGLRPMTQSYLPTLRERFIPRGIWTSWTGTEGLERAPAFMSRTSMDAFPGAGHPLLRRAVGENGETAPRGAPSPAGLPPRPPGPAREMPAVPGEDGELDRTIVGVPATAEATYVRSIPPPRSVDARSVDATPASPPSYPQAASPAARRKATPLPYLIAALTLLTLLVILVALHHFGLL